MEDQMPQPKGKGLKAVKMIVSVLVVFALGAGATAFAVTKYPEALGLSKGQAQAQAEVDALVSEVGTLLALPSDEKPTVATITDVEKLKEQPFFKNAANGDKVLIYTNAKKAILYRPSEKKVVEVGAVNINQQPKTGTSASPAPVASPVASPSN